MTIPLEDSYFIYVFTIKLDLIILIHFALTL